MDTINKQAVSSETLRQTLLDVRIIISFVEDMRQQVKSIALRDDLQEFHFRMETARKSLTSYLAVQRGEKDEQAFTVLWQEFMNEVRKMMLNSDHAYVKELIRCLKQFQKRLSELVHGALLCDENLHRILHVLYDDYAAAIFTFDRYLTTMDV